MLGDCYWGSLLWLQLCPLEAASLHPAFAAAHAGKMHGVQQTATRQLGGCDCKLVFESGSSNNLSPSVLTWHVHGNAFAATVQTPAAKQIHRRGS
jgi:hypothetical protein